MNTALLLYPALAKKPVSDPADLAHLLLDGMNNPSEITWLNAPDERIEAVSADGAYDTRKCHAAIAQRGAMGIIPTRKNAKLWKKNAPGVQTRNDIFRATQRFGSDLWKEWSGYHRRSLVETKMRCFKLLGERVMARTFKRQVVELQMRAAVLNRFTKLGCPVTVSVA